MRTVTEIAYEGRGLGERESPRWNHHFRWGRCLVALVSDCVLIRESAVGDVQSVCEWSWNEKVVVEAALEGPSARLNPNHHVRDQVR